MPEPALPEMTDEEVDMLDWLSLLWGDAWEGDEDLRVEAARQ